MNPTRVITWEDRLTRISFGLLLLATVYGVVVGAIITMYYDTTPDMGSLEDDLGAIPLLLSLLAVVGSFAHLLFAIGDFQQKLWKPAWMRAFVALSPLIIFLGVEGFIAHLLWWDAISETDRFHMLHHNLFAGVPLLLVYWLLLRWWWQPATLTTGLLLSPQMWVAGAFTLALVSMALGILIGVVSPLVFLVTLLFAIVTPLVWWLINRRRRKVAG